MLFIFRHLDLITEVFHEEPQKLKELFQLWRSLLTAQVAQLNRLELHWLNQVHKIAQVNTLASLCLSQLHLTDKSAFMSPLLALVTVIHTQRGLSSLQLPVWDLTFLRDTQMSQAGWAQGTPYF